MCMKQYIGSKVLRYATRMCSKPICSRTRLNLYCIAQARLVKLPYDLDVGAIIISPCMMLRSLPGF